MKNVQAEFLLPKKSVPAKKVVYPTTYRGFLLRPFGGISPEFTKSMLRLTESNH